MRYFKTLLVACSCFMAMVFPTQSEITIKGKVLDESGEALIGATVKVIGQDGNGAATDIDGTFSIQIIRLPVTLSIAYVGFATQEIEVKDAVNELSITLLEDLQTLDEVVITALGSSRYKKAQASSISTINANQLHSVASGNYRLQQESKRIHQRNDRNNYNWSDSESESYGSFV